MVEEVYDGRRMNATVDSRAPKADVAMSCTLRRTIGGPIRAQTLAIGPRGMQVRSQRPMSLDEIVGFELPDLGIRVGGRARVLRVERANVYALRFEGLPEPMVLRLHALATSGR
ncbi:hypothetical protein BH20ACT16_BH20ACT16_08350 [soil metagenome]